MNITIMNVVWGLCFYSIICLVFFFAFFYQDAKDNKEALSLYIGLWLDYLKKLLSRICVTIIAYFPWSLIFRNDFMQSLCMCMETTYLLTITCVLHIFLYYYLWALFFYYIKSSTVDEKYFFFYICFIYFIHRLCLFAFLFFYTYSPFNFFLLLLILLFQLIANPAQKDQATKLSDYLRHLRF